MLGDNNKYNGTKLLYTSFAQTPIDHDITLSDAHRDIIMLCYDATVQPKAVAIL